MKITLNKTLLGAVVILLIYLIPNWMFLDDAQLLLHDNLDSNVVWFKNLIQSGLLFGKNTDIIPNSLGGLPRSFYPSEFNVIALLNWVFSVKIAYHINIILIHFSAFFGMYLLAKNYFFKTKENQNVAILVALTFALIPFWPSGGLTIAGQPLLLYAFLNLITKHQAKSNWVIIALYPLYSSLIFGNLFVMFIGLVVYVLYAIYNRKIQYQVLIAFVLFTLMSICVEYRLFLMYLNEMPEVQRDTWMAKTGSLNWKGVIGVTTSLVFKGAYHFFGRIFPFIPLVVLGGWILSTKKNKIKIILLFVLLVCCSLPTVLKTNFLFAEKFSWLFVINPRFVSIQNLLWYIMFMMALQQLTLHVKFKKWMFQILFGVLIISHFFNWFKTDFQGSDYLENSFYYTFIDTQDYKYETLEEYYHVKEFTDFKKATKNTFNDQLLACIDIRPELAQYNGFKTVGGYFAIYPLAYCKKILYLKGEDISGICPSRCYLTGENMSNELIDKLRNEQVKILLSNERLNNLDVIPLFENKNSQFFWYKL